MNKKEINIIPIGDRVLIRPTTSLNENVNSFGFIIPAKEGETKFERGIVIATGPGRTNAEGKRIKMETKLGDISSTCSARADGQASAPTSMPATAMACGYVWRSHRT